MTMPSKSGPFRDIKKNSMLYCMFIPVALYFLAFAYIPMSGIVLAFKEFNYSDGIFLSPWNGLKNIQFFFASGSALRITINTVLYNVLFLSSYIVISILLAILLSEIRGRFFKKSSQSVMLFTYFISWVIVASFLYNIFNYEYGVLNTILKSLGRDAVDIYSSANSNLWYLILPILYVWKWAGYGSVLYLSAIMGIDQECYESATIDGANAFQKITKITLPLLMPTTVILLLLGIGRVMRGEFDMFYQIIGNNGMLFDKTDIIDTFVFRALMTTQDFGMAASAGVYQSVLCFLIILSANTLVRRIEPDYALF
jgi:putative aldouronate transport system permease protein